MVTCNCALRKFFTRVYSPLLMYAVHSNCLCLSCYQYHLSSHNIRYEQNSPFKTIKSNQSTVLPEINKLECFLNSCRSLYLHLSCSLADHWGTTGDFTTNFLHFSLFSAFHSMIFHSRPIQSLMLSSHHFLCQPLRLPPCTFPCRTVLASPDGHVTCPYHFSLHLFTEVFIRPDGIFNSDFHFLVGCVISV